MADISHFTLPLPTFDFKPKILVITAPYYKRISDCLREGCIAKLTQAHALIDSVDVPGALEIPSALHIAAHMGTYDGYVALGCVIRGETTHYETVCNMSAQALMELGLKGHAIGNGILTVENSEQAYARADPAQQDKGGGAAMAALHLIALKKKFK